MILQFVTGEPVANIFLDQNLIYLPVHCLFIYLSLYCKIYRHIIRVTLHEWIYIMLFTFMLHQLVN